MFRANKEVEEYFFGSPRAIAEKILFIKREARLAEYRARLHDSIAFGNVWRGITGTLRGEKISIIATGIGPSMVGDCAFALNRPGAACLYSGTCGSLDGGIPIGGYVLARNAICGDGYSFTLSCAPLTQVSADAQVFGRLADAFQSAGVMFAEVTSFTTASVVRENEADFWECVSPNCKTIEMGCASFYAACLKSRKKPAAYFWVTDRPILGQSFFDPLSHEDKQRKQEAYQNAVSTDIAVICGL